MSAVHRSTRSTLDERGMVRMMEEAETLSERRIDLRREYEESGVAAVLDELDRELVGLKPVKTRIREIAALLLVERARKRLGLAHDTPTLHMS